MSYLIKDSLIYNQAMREYINGSILNGNYHEEVSYWSFEME